MAFVFLFCSMQGNIMDWARAIERNSEALNGIVEVLFVLLGLVGDATVGRIPPTLRRAVLRVLRPAESAMRRLIVIAARGLVVKLAAAREMPPGPIIRKGGGSRRLSFQLFDPRKRFKPLRVMKFTRLVPRIHFFGPDPRVVALFPAPRPVVEPPPPPGGLVNAARLTRRLLALKSALDDLPRQAKRLARWQQRRKASPDHKFLTPLRPGHPPGHRRKPIHEVDEVLIECDGLAWEAMKPDTS
jgi:hypothetical protein